MSTFIIIKSQKPASPNWDGKGFSKHPAKIYTSFSEASEALEAYWLGDAARMLNPRTDRRIIEIVPLSEENLNTQLTRKEIRW